MHKQKLHSPSAIFWWFFFIAMLKFKQFRKKMHRILIEFPCMCKCSVQRTMLNVPEVADRVAPPTRNMHVNIFHSVFCCAENTIVKCQLSAWTQHACAVRAARRSATNECTHLHSTFTILIFQLILLFRLFFFCMFRTWKPDMDVTLRCRTLEHGHPCDTSSIFERNRIDFFGLIYKFGFPRGRRAFLGWWGSTYV